MFKNVVCEICTAEIIKKVSSFDFKSKLLGNISIPAVEQYVCSGCGKVLMPLAEGRKIREYVQKKEQEAIEGLPVGDFVSLNEAATILGITKQAFSKNPRIKRGLICSAIIDKKNVYLKKSVEEFKRTGKDGRLRLNVEKVKTIYKEVVPFIPIDWGGVYAKTDYAFSRSSLPEGNPYVTCNDFDKQFEKHCVANFQGK